MAHTQFRCTSHSHFTVYTSPGTLTQSHSPDSTPLPSPLTPLPPSPNPPSTPRLTEGADEAWVEMGHFLKREAAGGTAWLLSGNPQLTRGMRLSSSASMTVEQAGGKLKFLKYALRAPGEKPPQRERRSDPIGREGDGGTAEAANGEVVESTPRESVAVAAPPEPVAPKVAPKVVPKVARKIHAASPVADDDAIVVVDATGEDSNALQRRFASMYED